MSKSKKSLTTCDMWNEVCKEMENTNILPYWLDYYLADKPTDIRDIEFDVKGDLKFGVNEGIYLNLYICGNFGSEQEHLKAGIGTFKTLNIDDESFRQMAILMANFILAARKWIDNNEEDLVHPGYNCELPGVNFSVWVKDRNRALKYKEDGYKITDLCTGKKM